MTPDLLAEFKAAATREQEAWSAVASLLPGSIDDNADCWIAWRAAVLKCMDVRSRLHPSWPPVDSDRAPRRRSRRVNR